MMISSVGSRTPGTNLKKAVYPTPPFSPAQVDPLGGALPLRGAVDETGACACTVVVRVVIVGGLVADAVLVWVGMDVADD
jgi:hypothetical protein